MKFWIDLRLATDAGETVQRVRVSGSIRGADFEILNDKVIECLEGIGASFDREQDRTQIGAPAAGT